MIHFSATTSAFGASDAQTSIQQLVVLNQALQQRAVELEEAKNEAEQAGAGDTSLDSMSTDDLVEKMAAAPLYAALGREGTHPLFGKKKIRFLIFTF